MPKIFKWYKDDFGFSKQEILAYYASFMQQDVRQVCGLAQCGYIREYTRLESGTTDIEDTRLYMRPCAMRIHAHTRLYICSSMDFWQTYIILVGLAAGADR